MRIDGISKFLKVNKRLIVHFHYHLKCEDITDNEGDIELESMESSQNTVFACNLSKLIVFNEDRCYFQVF